MSVFIIAEAGVNHNGMTAVSDYQADDLISLKDK
jgi:hypothetical protein